MHTQSPFGKLYAVDARDSIAQAVTQAYDASDNIRFFLVRACGAESAIAFVQSITATRGSK